MASYTTHRLTVIGAGQMGAGIAYAAITAGRIPTTLFDVNEISLNKGSKLIKKLLDRQVEKDRMSSTDASNAFKLLKTSQDLPSAVKSADIVVEAIPEIPSLKTKLFADLAQMTEGKNTILGSNTSSISLTKLAAAAKGAEHRVIGTHFFNPVNVLKGAEVIRALQTSDEVNQAAVDFLVKLNKEPSVSKDSPGFIANRILIPMMNEAVFTLEEGVATPKDIDNIMRNGCGMPMGPLQLADLVGLDTVLAIAEVLHTETGDPKFRAPVTLRNLVAAGYLGKKAGRGFYDYSGKL